MRGIGLKMDLNRLRDKITLLGGEIRPEVFWPVVLDYTRKSLNTCVRTTPARSAQLIRPNQRRQYRNRVNYIPSYHDTVDPSLVVKPDGSMWMFSGGKWYRPDRWDLPDQVWGVFQSLMDERERRLSKSETEFIDERLPARGLYKKSWMQVGESLGLSIGGPEVAKKALTRRKPPVNPPRGYAQRRGGKKTISIVIYNPMIEAESEYKDFDPVKILADAIAQHRPNFDAQIQRRLSRVLYAVMHK